MKTRERRRSASTSRWMESGGSFGGVSHTSSEGGLVKRAASGIIPSSIDWHSNRTWDSHELLESREHISSMTRIPPPSWSEASHWQINENVHGSFFAERTTHVDTLIMSSGMSRTEPSLLASVVFPPPLGPIMREFVITWTGRSWRQPEVAIRATGRRRVRRACCWGDRILRFRFVFIFQKDSPGTRWARQRTARRGHRNEIRR